MLFTDVLRSQFGAPSGLIGSWLVAPFLNVMNRGLMNAAIELLEPAPGDKVLDVGFGGGYSLLALAERVTRGEVVGIDHSREMVQMASRAIKARRLGRHVRAAWGDVGGLSYPDQTFDRALAVSTIYYWPDLQAGFAEIGRVLKPGGRLAIGFRSRWTLRPLTVGWSHFRLYDGEEVARSMRATGFRAVSVNRRMPDSIVVIGERRRRRS